MNFSKDASSSSAQVPDDAKEVFLDRLSLFGTPSLPAGLLFVKYSKAFI
jgi:hypothetical protein